MSIGRTFRIVVLVCLLLTLLVFPACTGESDNKGETVAQTGAADTNQTGFPPTDGRPSTQTGGAGG